MSLFLLLVAVVLLAIVFFSGEFYLRHVSGRALTAQAWLLLFSRYGSRLRSEVREYLNEFPLNPAFGRSYLRTMDHAGGGMSEQIELQDMLEDSNHEE